MNPWQRLKGRDIFRTQFLSNAAQPQTLTNFIDCFPKDAGGKVRATFLQVARCSGQILMHAVL